MSLNARINALERYAAPADAPAPTAVFTEPGPDGLPRAFIPDGGGGLIELRRVRQLDTRWIFSTSPGTPDQLRAEAAMTDDELSAGCTGPAPVVMHLAWVGAAESFHGGRLGPIRRVE
ncbi:MAG TPA: hypothetical protein VGF55_19450 [Gemmataceae bacterium]